MIGCHTARKPLLFMCLRGVNDYGFVYGPGKTLSFDFSIDGVDLLVDGSRVLICVRVSSIDDGAMRFAKIKSRPNHDSCTFVL